MANRRCGHHHCLFPNFGLAALRSDREPSILGGGRAFLPVGVDVWLGLIASAVCRISTYRASPRRAAIDGIRSSACPTDFLHLRDRFNPLRCLAHRVSTISSSGALHAGCGRGARAGCLRGAPDDSEHPMAPLPRSFPSGPLTGSGFANRVGARRNRSGSDWLDRTVQCALSPVLSLAGLATSDECQLRASWRYWHLRFAPVVLSTPCGLGGIKTNRVLGNLAWPRISDRRFTAHGN